MFDDLKKELADLAEKIARRGKLVSMLESLGAEERGLSERETELRAALNKENADVVRLERTSAASIFYSVLGKKGERIEKEQREAYAAKIKYGALVRQLDDCRDRIVRLTAERDALADCGERYDEVFRQIQKELKSDPRYADRICELEKSIGENASQLREIKEAADAGNAAMLKIESIDDSLSSAEGWGTLDIMGGGFISDLVKHSHMDEAQAGAEELQILLSRFNTELSDVKVTAQMGQVNVDGFLRFADYFFDGFIADWCVLSHIQDSQKSVNEVREQVASALSGLDALMKDRMAEKDSLELELSALVKNA